MSCLYNPDWIKSKEGSWTLSSGTGFGVVKPQITRDYSWEVFSSLGGAPLAKGSAPDRIAAFTEVEAKLGYKFFVEQEYEPAKGCRCGSCEDPTGKWRVWDRADKVNLVFDNESEAIAWILSQHAIGVT